MSLVLTRKVGEALVFQREGAGHQRIHIISIEGNTVRLAIDAADDVVVVREELLHPSQKQPYHRRRRGDWPSLIAAGSMTAFALMKMKLMIFLM